MFRWDGPLGGRLGKYWCDRKVLPVLRVESERHSLAGSVDLCYLKQQIQQS